MSHVPHVQSDPSAGVDTASGGEFDALVVGAGFGGLYMLRKLREEGLRVRVIDAGDGPGGVWNWNRYPGARCDVESPDYCYSFDDELAREWTWSERYASGPELRAYFNHVVDRFDLRKDIQFGTRVESAVFDETRSRWTLTTDGGELFSAPFAIMATGCLSIIQYPQLDGLENFAGRAVHTGAWPREGVDFSGQRVGVIGTGSSGIQVVPEIAKEAEHLYVFQRTPNHVVPSQNGPLAAETLDDIKASYPERRAKALDSFFGLPLEGNPQVTTDATPEERRKTYQERWDAGGFNFLLSFADIIIDKDANASAAEFIREKIRELVRDAAVADRLLPGDHPVGTKRICVETGYFEAFNRDDVTLVDARDAAIVKATERGIETTAGEIELDTIVFATGYDAMTGSLSKIDIRGRGGASLRDKWADGPVTYLGLQTSGFPNLFSVAGPGSPSVLSNVPLSCEHHVEWIASALVHMREHNIDTLEATPEAEAAWTQHLIDTANFTLYREADSWYVGANTPGKPRVFTAYPGGVNAYHAKCREVVENGYEGFALQAAGQRQTVAAS